MRAFTLFSLFLLPFSARACLTPEELRELGLDAHADEVALLRRQQTTPPENITLPIGKGDRFNGGAIAPRGLGSQKPGVVTQSILNLVEIRSAVLGLVKEFDLEFVEAPLKTSDGNTIFGAKVGKGSNTAFSAFLEAGIHSRERGGPDNLIYFIADLLWAKREKTGLQYGDVSYSNADVLRALSVGIVFFPLLNPDGAAFDLATGACWRKNRNPAASKASDPNTIGVDLNRNFDIYWNLTKYFAPGAGSSSDNPAATAFHGTAPFSEVETQSIKWVMDTFPSLKWFLDLHSTSAVVLYPWGDDTNQVTTPTMNFANPAFDGKRGVVPDQTGLEYQAYIDPKDLNVFSTVATSMVNRMIDSTGHTYQALQIANLYPTAGSSGDYAYARHIVDPKKQKIFGFGLEFGEMNWNHACPFYPTVELHNRNVLEVGVGLMELLLGAAKN